jgi:nucleoside 2-deoxyribosyltransferase
MSFYAIIINVPEAKNECLIASPFAPEFTDVMGAIKEAAIRLRLQPLWIKTGEMEISSDFVQDIITGTRSAKIVVAVCSPESTGKPNPNVMYEVGLAHALGKQTMLLTSDPEKLPADLRTKHVHLYNPASVNSKDGINGIQLAMSERIKEMSEANPLTDRTYRDISVAQEGHLMLLKPIFWENFRTILSFGRDVHDEVQGIDTAAVDKLRKASEDMAYNPGDFTTLKSFAESWGIYDNYFQLLTKARVFEPLEDKIAAVERAFDFLSQESGNDSSIKKLITKSRGFYDIIRDRLRGYPALHDNTSNAVERMPPGAQQSGEIIINLSLQVRKLSDTTKTIILQSDRLIVNIIEMILRTGD